jgi:hypothetical protein
MIAEKQPFINRNLCLGKNFRRTFPSLGRNQKGISAEMPF